MKSKKGVPKGIFVTELEIRHHALDNKYYENSLEYILKGEERRRAIGELRRFVQNHAKFEIPAYAILQKLKQMEGMGD